MLEKKKNLKSVTQLQITKMEKEEKINLWKVKGRK